MSNELNGPRKYGQRLTKKEVREVIGALNTVLVTNDGGHAVYTEGQDDASVADLMRATIPHCTKYHVRNVRRSVFGGARGSSLDGVRKYRAPTAQQKPLPLPVQVQTKPTPAAGPTLAERVEMLERRLRSLEVELGVIKP